MKGLSKRRRMAFPFFEYLLLFQRNSSFCSKIDDVTNRFSTKINDNIKNISGNIGVMLLKLGTKNVHKVRNKMTHIMTLPLFYYRSSEHAHFGKNPFTCVRALTRALGTMTCTDLRLRDICARVIAYVTPARKEIYCYSKL